jgi:hypothetical protein
MVGGIMDDPLEVVTTEDRTVEDIMVVDPEVHIIISFRK